jgi:hypothetical protein
VVFFSQKRGLIKIQPAAVAFETLVKEYDRPIRFDLCYLHTKKENRCTFLTKATIFYEQFWESGLILPITFSKLLPHFCPEV